MNFNHILKQKNITKYRLSKISGVPFATLSDISTGKAKIENALQIHFISWHRHST